MNKVILIILVIGGYFIGMFISKILITIYDHTVESSSRINDSDLIMILLWPLVIPLFLLIWLFEVIYKTGANVGDSIWKLLRGNKDE
jgi:uncharacterized BrkB/YihY/UPF0761 family membrane protein